MKYKDITGTDFSNGIESGQFQGVQKHTKRMKLYETQERPISKLNVRYFVISVFYRVLELEFLSENEN